MDTAFALISILAVLAIGVVSPGPSFIVVTRTAFSASRRAAAACALGMAAGAMLLSIAALLGLSAILRQTPAAYLALKVGGGVYLVYLAWKTWRGASTPLGAPQDATQLSGGMARHFGMAALTMLSNPKAAVQYGVVFAAMLPPAPSAALLWLLPPAIFALEASWYLVVAFALSSATPRQAYLKAKCTIDRVAGALLAALGIKLILSGRA